MGTLDRRPPVTERSFGIVLVRPTSPPGTQQSGPNSSSSSFQVLLVHQHLRSGSSPSVSTFIALPKGHMDPDDETPLDAAIRELEEETSLRISRSHILCDGATIRERYTNPKNGKEKENTFWIAGLKEGEGEKLVVQEEEVLKAEWVDAAEACDRVTFKETRLILEEALMLLHRFTSQ
ncbi:hypothetical protein JAAARDRAFT_33303 [Jaapia argillacea MUCL 33604]|uniref:Nudix hydrolase domain-containing protein n=1 Tax=Jaapia argillacea MUCL 33604 TaxID=933084 RepID=A0A067QAX6_9AGAM|nr:hypothetical protein JAAARDRAFT_33303 [Jaapia argillacea MUCL 33604]